MNLKYLQVIDERRGESVTLPVSVVSAKALPY